MLICPIFSYGQISIGPSVGVNFSNIKTTTMLFNYEIGPYIGLKIQYELKANLFFTATPGYLEKGGRVSKQLGPDIESYSEFDFEYLDLPLLIGTGYNIGFLKINPSIGFSVGYLLSADVKIPRLENNQIVVDSYNLLEPGIFKVINTGVNPTDINKVSFGPVGSISLLVPTSGSAELFLDIRFTYEIRNVFVTAAKLRKFSNNYLTIAGGVLF